MASPYDLVGCYFVLGKGSLTPFTGGKRGAGVDLFQVSCLVPSFLLIIPLHSVKACGKIR